MAIVLDNITYTYGMGTPFEKTALRGVSLTIENGEFLTSKWAITSYNWYSYCQWCRY